MKRKDDHDSSNKLWATNKIFMYVCMYVHTHIDKCLHINKTITLLHVNVTLRNPYTDFPIPLNDSKNIVLFAFRHQIT